MRRELVAFSSLFVWICAGCASPQTPPSTTKAEKNTPSTVAYDLEHIDEHAGLIANSLRHMYALEQTPTYSAIDPRVALDTIDAMNSLENFPKTSADALRAHLRQPGVLVYSFHLQAPPGTMGLPHSIYLIPSPTKENQAKATPGQSPGIVIVNIARPNTPLKHTTNKTTAVVQEPTFIKREQLQSLLQQHPKLLLVVGGECGAYDAFKHDSPLAGLEHFHIMHTEDDAFWRGLLGPQLLMSPTIVYFEDGKAVDAHYGYNRTRRSSLEAFLARHGYIQKPTHYGTIDAAYVSANFPSREAFAQWLVLNKTSLSGIVIEGVDLSGMLLSGCSLNGSILRDVNLEEADLRQCDLRCARLENTSLEHARIDASTALPTTCL